MTEACRQDVFGNRRQAHTIIIARGEKVRHFTIHPWLGRSAIAFVFAAALGGAGAALHVGLDMDQPYFNGETGALAASYEFRIASLRSEVDRLTTRSFLDRQTMSTKVDALLDQQAELAERYSRLQPILDRARSSGLMDQAVPTPQPKPAEEKPSGNAMNSAEPLAFVQPNDERTLDRFKLIDGRRGASSAKSETSNLPPEVIRKIGQSIDDAEMKQIESLDLLTSSAHAKTEAIGEALRTEGVGRLVLPAAGNGGEGGPYVPVPLEHRFEAGLVELSAALDSLQDARDASRALPLAMPVSSTAISSTFGVREDPFLGKAAMHTGIDFVAEAGTAAKATAAGTVTFAGENGGYGRMVEIDHGNGLATRYAHLSAIEVGVGDKVVAGGTVGRVGSTGRSTGPHLHYEVRRTGEAVDPARYLKAGRRINALG